MTWFEPITESLRPDEDNEAKARSDEPSEKKTPGHNGKALNGSAGEDEGRGSLLGTEFLGHFPGDLKFLTLGNYQQWK